MSAWLLGPLPRPRDLRRLFSTPASLRASPRVWWLKLTIAAGLASALLLSRPLWLDARAYPLTPLLPAVFGKAPPAPFDALVFAALMLLLLSVTVARKAAGPIAAFVGLAFVWALFDQSRWQPWFYQYLFMLVALGLWFAGSGNSLRRAAALDSCRLIVASVYFWSGVQKANPGFVHTTFPWMLEPLTNHLPAAAQSWLLPLACLAPLVETGIAVGLLTRRFRNPAVVAAVAMHLGILAALVARGANLVVWPWNIAMAASVALLFWKSQEVRARQILWSRALTFQAAVFILFTLAPALSLFNLWDNYLSFALYAGNRNSATIYMPASVAGRLPREVKDLLWQDDGNVDELPVADWSWAALHVPPYPELRIYRNVARAICADTASDPGVKLVVDGKTSWLRPTRQYLYTCATLP